MKNVIWETPLYEFLRMCNESNLPKTILDCGAGGSEPPLSLFYEFGYKTYGVELSSGSLAESAGFCREKDMALHIIGGDMRFIPFPDRAFSFVYSFNAIDFQTKPDIANTIGEFKRVLRMDGLCFVNFLSVDDQETWDPFCQSSTVRKILKSERFSHFEDDEADPFFEGYEVLRKKKILTDKLWDGRLRKRAELIYIVRKIR